MTSFLGWQFYRSTLYYLKKYLYVFPRYVVVNKGEKNQDIEKFLWMFNDSQNKGYLYAGSLVGRKEGKSYGVEKEF